ncbi:MAG: TraR/DksA C4-type zinc finger protein [Salinarimonas sp.]|nr:TraR/DksA C4-type zinc finger protein [Salinarimonas sp.]
MSAEFSNDEKELLTELRTRIEAELAEIEALLEETEADSAPVALDQQSVGRLARMDAMQVQAMAQAAQARRLGRRQGLLFALRRMDDGEYLECQACGEEIGAGRLRADPTFHRCVRCAR